MKKYNVGFVLSHPIQYFSPLFKLLSKENWINLKVYYCSDETIKRFADKGFGKEIKWDIPLLDDYNYIFLKNFNKKGSIKSGFLGLINLSIPKKLRDDEREFVIVHGWNYFSLILTILGSKIFGYNVFLRGESPLNQELEKPKWKLFLKKLLLKHFLFRFVNRFLFIGEENKKFYKYYGVKDNKLFFTPYCVNNEFFRSKILSEEKKEKKRKELGIKNDEVVILFVGKLVEKKRPFDIIKAFEKLSKESQKNSVLLIVGDGILREELKKYVKEKELKVIFAGFRNQTELPSFYSIADVFVLPSDIGETWGLVVNEAMNFELPIIISNIVGCSSDLVKHNENGFIFKKGNINELSKYMDILINKEELRKKFGKKSIEIIDEYNYKNVIKGIHQATNSFYIKGKQ